MKRPGVIIAAFICLAGSLNGIIAIPVMDLTSWLGEMITFAEELEKVQEFIGLYKQLSFKLGERVRDVKKGFKGMVTGKISGIVKFEDALQETIEDTSYYADYLRGSILDRVNKGEKLIDIVKEMRDIESELKSREMYKDPTIKIYTDEFLEAYYERLARLEDRIAFLGMIKETGKNRLTVFEDRYKLFEDIAIGKDSKAGDKVGSESQAITVLSESIVDTALQDQEIAIMMRLSLEEEVSYELNKIYLDNLKLSTLGKRVNQ